MSNLAALQRRVANFTRAHELDTPVEARLLDLVAEVGELAKERLKGTDYGRAEGLAAGWSDEFEDVLFALICLANTTHVAMETTLLDALAKYERRLAAGGAASSNDASR